MAGKSRFVQSAVGEWPPNVSDLASGMKVAQAYGKRI
jgi:hypothetical protein